MQESRFIAACFGKPVDRTPIWVMRQAGRYLPSYRAVRSKNTFLEMCKTPSLSCEVTLQPIQQFGFDAAILFSDILIPLEKMGLPIEFTEEGPKLPQPVTSLADVDKLQIPDPVLAMPYVLDAVSAIRKALPAEVPLIGFCGAPFTLATYALEGGGSKNFEKTKRMMFGEPAGFAKLMDKLAACSVSYLLAQVEAGAQAVQLFDSWAGILSPQEFVKWPLRFTAQVISGLRSSPLIAEKKVPIIYFVNGVAPYLDRVGESGADVLGVDWRVSLAHVRNVLREKSVNLSLQGNMDPCALFGSEQTVVSAAHDVLRAAGPGPGHIFNLGHGILPPTNPERVKTLVETVHAWRKDEAFA